MNAHFQMEMTFQECLQFHQGCLLHYQRHQSFYRGCITLSGMSIVLLGTSIIDLVSIIEPGVSIMELAGVYR